MTKEQKNKKSVPKPFAQAPQNCHEKLKKAYQELEQQVEGRTAELKKERDRLQTYLDVAGVMFLSLDTDGNIVHINRKGGQVLGWEPGEIIGKNWFDHFLPVNVRTRVKSVFKKLMGGEMAPFEYYENSVLSRDGQEKNIIWHNSLLKGDDGTIVGALASGEDVTERKRAVAALKESELKFRMVTETIKDVFWMNTCDLTKMVYVSPSYETLWERSMESIYAAPTSFLEAVHPEDLGILLRIGDKCHKHGKPYECEYRMVRKNGEIRWIHERGYPVPDASGQTRLMAGVCTDISERKQAELARNKLQAQLLQTQKTAAIGTLAGGIAHDFNNILTVIIGFTELALDEVDMGTSIEDNLQEVYSAGKRAKELVKQILTFARQYDEELKPIPIKPIVKEAIRFIRSSIPATIEIIHHIESDALIMGNATQVHQILMNLFTNAAQAMENDGGIMEVCLKDVAIDKDAAIQKMGLKPGNHVVLTVSDTGVGIVPDIIGCIFEPYFTTKKPGEGTGMGLAMVHGIVESYGGKVLVDSQPGQGTRFTVYLPVTLRRQESNTYEPEVLPIGKERILLVDDEAPIADMGRQMLERLGYGVQIRTSSVEALELFRSKPDDFNLVITDMTMPNLTGDRLAAELKTIRPHIPVILCTGYSKKVSDETATGIGVQAVIYKPIVKAKLAKTVRRVLDQAGGDPRD